MAKEEEYKELFLAEAQENHEQLNNLFTELEKDIASKTAVDAIFRITHTLKGNAMGMGFSAIAELSHVMEDIFNEVKTGRLKLDLLFFNSLFKANDTLGQLINSIQTGADVKYIGIKTKLEVALRNARQNTAAPVNENVQEQEQNISPTESVELAANLPFAIDATQQVEDESDYEGEDPAEQKITISDMVQVPVRKLDYLLNIIGELIIERDALIARHTDRGHKVSELARLQRITSDLQFGVMDIRLVQIGFLFSKFHRIVRDVAALENKKVDLVLEGTDIEIDRNILRIMSDSLVHLVRNSVSHGIESVEERMRLGKPETGKVTLTARSEKDTVYIHVTDDGKGIDVALIKRKALEKGIITPDFANIMDDDEVLMCLFEPGFSSAEKITEVSGRGVGMDVVKRAAESIGGRVLIQTELGKGSTFTLALPSSMAVKGALLFELQKQVFAIALNHTEAVISLQKHEIHKVSSGLASSYLGKTIPVFFLHDLFNLDNRIERDELYPYHHTFDRTDAFQKLDVVVVTHNNRLVGLVVDKLVQQKEIVEKTLSKPVDHIDLFSGATILGNGDVCLVLNIIGIISNLYKEKKTH